MRLPIYRKKSESSRILTRASAHIAKFPLLAPSGKMFTNWANSVRSATNQLQSQLATQSGGVPLLIRRICLINAFSFVLQCKTCQIFKNRGLFAKLKISTEPAYSQSSKLLHQIFYVPTIKNSQQQITIQSCKTANYRPNET